MRTLSPFLRARLHMKMLPTMLCHGAAGCSGTVPQGPTGSFSMVAGFVSANDLTWLRKALDVKSRVSIPNVRNIAEMATRSSTPELVPRTLLPKLIFGGVP